MSEFIAGPHPYCSEHARFEHAEKGIITPCIIYYYSMAVWKYGCSEIQVSGETGLVYTWLCSWMGSSCLIRPAKRNTGSAGAGVLRLARGSVRVRTGGGRLYHSSFELAAREVALVVVHELLVVAPAGGDFRGAK